MAQLLQECVYYMHVKMSRRHVVVDHDNQKYCSLDVGATCLCDDIGYSLTIVKEEVLNLFLLRNLNFHVRK